MVSRPVWIAIVGGAALAAAGWYVRGQGEVGMPQGGPQTADSPASAKSVETTPSRRREGPSVNEAKPQPHPAKAAVKDDEAPDEAAELPASDALAEPELPYEEQRGVELFDQALARMEMQITEAKEAGDMERVAALRVRQARLRRRREKRVRELTGAQPL